MKEIALASIHKELGARMVPFAGYNMPVSYEGVNKEHETVRNGIGIFDVSHMGMLFVRGDKALELLQRTCSNDASTLAVGKAQYTYFPNETGGVIDDFILYRTQENEYLLVVNASNTDKDWEWLVKHNTEGAELENATDDYSIFAIQGPKTTEAIQPLTEVNLSDLKFYSFEYADFAGASDVLISATGYTGSGGFEVYVKNTDAEKVWNTIMEAGKAFDIAPIGLAARDTLRLEMGYCLYGNDIDETTSPLEAGLGWITKFNKDFINAENLKSAKKAGLTNKLIGFELTERGIPRQDYDIVDAEGEKIGRVTSGTMSPSLGKAIGMGYVPLAYSKPDTEIFIQIRKKQIPAKVVKTPFYKG
ncbi:MAG TPA: glycine cleavage system aminomethyltransferase GcvT [Flavobacteriaceae bacterium]|nr:glycine cleavage system aminomethyltransferase GcvT [Flavobacteriaceae bacterium]